MPKKLGMKRENWRSDRAEGKKDREGRKKRKDEKNRKERKDESEERKCWK